MEKGLWKKKRTHLITRRPAPTEAGTDTPFISSVTAYRTAENLPCSKLSKCAKIIFFEGFGLWISGKENYSPGSPDGLADLSSKRGFPPSAARQRKVDAATLAAKFQTLKSKM